MRIHLDGNDDNFMATACKNPDGTIALAVFNLLGEDKTYQITIGEKDYHLSIPGQGLQSVVLSSQK